MSNILPTFRLSPFDCKKINLKNGCHKHHHERSTFDPNNHLNSFKFLCPKKFNAGNSEMFISCIVRKICHCM